MVTPRFAWAPPRSRSLGPECVAFWRAAGGTLFDWQELAIEQILGLDDEEKWASATDGLNVARQNGKGVVLQAIETFAAFELGCRVVMHTSHEFATSQEHQLRLESFIQDASHLHARVRAKGGYVHANGQESIRLKDGARILFKARTKGGGRGYSGDLLVWDEAMVLPDAVVGAQMPMTRATQWPFGRKVIYAGSAVDQEVHEHGQNFARLRQRGITRQKRVSWLEYSAPFDEPDELDEESLADRSLWRLANPSMAEGLVSEETMAGELEDMPPRTFAVELLGVGDWPRLDGVARGVFAPDLWASLADPESMVPGEIVFAVDVRPDRAKAAIVVCGYRDDELLHVAVVDMRPGTKWVVPELVRLRDMHHPRAIVRTAHGPVAALKNQFEEARLEVTELSATEFGEACGRFADLVEQRGLRHLGETEFLTAVKGAKTRPMGDAWAWSRKMSKADVSPLVAATVAVWFAEQRLTTVYADRGILVV